MSKSLISAKVLGGGIAGASGIVGTGYGITRYLKSEETNVSDQSSLPTAEVVSETQESTSPSEVQSTPILEEPSEDSRSDEGSSTRDDLGSTHADPLQRTSEVREGAENNSLSDGQEQPGLSDSTKIDKEPENVVDPKSTKESNSPSSGTLQSVSDPVTSELPDHAGASGDSEKTTGTLEKPAVGATEQVNTN